MSHKAIYATTIRNANLALAKQALDFLAQQRKGQVTQHGQRLSYSDDEIYSDIEIQNGELSISGDSMYERENQKFKSDFEQMYTATATILAAQALGYQVETQSSPTGEILLSLTQP